MPDQNDTFHPLSEFKNFPWEKMKIISGYDCFFKGIEFDMNSSKPTITFITDNEDPVHSPHDTWEVPIAIAMLCRIHKNRGASNALQKVREALEI